MKVSASESGFTLIESIFSFVIIAIAMTGLVAVWSNAASRSADPFWQSQTSALGRLYIEEIHALGFSEINNYAGDIKSLNGVEISGYTGFKVKITVLAAGQDFGLADNSLKKVTVVINTATGKSQQFVTYRGRY